MGPQDSTKTIRVEVQIGAFRMHLGWPLKLGKPFMEGAVTAEFQQKRFVLFSNFDVGPDLKKALQEVCRLVDPLDSDPNSTRDASMLDALLAAQRRASDAFFADIKRVALAKVVLKRGVSFLSENMDVARILKLEREVAGGYNDDNESAKLK